MFLDPDSAKKEKNAIYFLFINKLCKYELSFFHRNISLSKPKCLTILLCTCVSLCCDIVVLLTNRPLGYLGLSPKNFMRNVQAQIRSSPITRATIDLEPKIRTAEKILILLPKKITNVSVCTTYVSSYICLFTSRNHLLQQDLIRCLQSSLKTFFSLAYFLNQVNAKPGLLSTQMADCGPNPDLWMVTVGPRQHLKSVLYIQKFLYQYVAHLAVLLKHLLLANCIKRLSIKLLITYIAAHA